MQLSAKHKEQIRQEALNAGFLFCGFARARKLDDDARRLESWLLQGNQAGMGYMERNFDLRVDPTLLMPGAKTIISLLYNYYPAEQQNPDAAKIARYAFGEDYHDVIRAKLNKLLSDINTDIAVVNGRGFVDSAPVLERAWANLSGAGWIGKNGNLITPGVGSYYFIASLIVDLDIEPDNPFITDHCGTCTRCIDACPTDAITSSGEVDARKCISYHTIELKDAMISPEIGEKLEGWMFGCDICQEVCPWNRFSTPHAEPAFAPIPGILDLTTQDWERVGEVQFNTRFRKSPIRRAKWNGILRNLKALGGNF